MLQIDSGQDCLQSPTIARYHQSLHSAVAILLIGLPPLLGGGVRLVIGFGAAAEMLQLVGDVTVSLQLIVAATTVCSPTTYNPHGMWILRFLSREPLLLQIPSSRSRSTKRSLVNISLHIDTIYTYTHNVILMSIMSIVSLSFHAQFYYCMLVYIF